MGWSEDFFIFTKQEVDEDKFQNKENCGCPSRKGSKTQISISSAT
jgi:hypothetical protein